MEAVTGDESYDSDSSHAILRGWSLRRSAGAGRARRLSRKSERVTRYAMPAVWTENTPAEVLRVACGDDCNTVVSGCWI